MTKIKKFRRVVKFRRIDFEEVLYYMVTEMIMSLFALPIYNNTSKVFGVLFVILFPLAVIIYEMLNVEIYYEEVKER